MSKLRCPTSEWFTRQVRNVGGNIFIVALGFVLLVPLCGDFNCRIQAESQGSLHADAVEERAGADGVGVGESCRARLADDVGGKR